MSSATAAADQVLADCQPTFAPRHFLWTRGLRTVLTLAVGTVGVSLCVMTVDQTVATYFAQNRLPGELNRLVTLSETFAHGTGVFMILLAMLGVEPTRWRAILRVAACAFGSGILANLLKVSIPRLRPREVDLAAVNGWEAFQIFSDHSCRTNFFNGAVIGLSRCCAPISTF